MLLGMTTQSAATHYLDHIRERQVRAEAALTTEGFETLILDAGSPFTHFADDQDAPFRTNPQFASWVPLEGPHHKLVIRAGHRPRLVVVRPDDYWYEPIELGSPYWLEPFEVQVVPDAERAWAAAHGHGRTAFVGDASAQAKAHGLHDDGLNPQRLAARLDWDRSYKTAYEVACLEEATRVSARAHHEAKRAFLEGASELEIHHVYLEAAGCVEHALPYESIIALDEKGAFLHYVNKRTKRGGRVLLIDVGAKHAGYGCDITRTWTAPACDTLFRDLVQSMDRIQLDLCNAVKPGVPYLQLHLDAHRRIGSLLHSAGVLDCGGDEALALGLTRPFFPHGLGHFLGIQVHDVAGRQATPSGGTAPPPADHPYLRTTRTIEERMLFTIEPGLYFIDMLLKPMRSSPLARHVRWDLVDRLMPCGGIRIEDNLLVTAHGHRNLTRPHLP